MAVIVSAGVTPCGGGLRPFRLGSHSAFSYLDVSSIRIGRILLKASDIEHAEQIFERVFRGGCCFAEALQQIASSGVAEAILSFGRPAVQAISNGLAVVALVDLVQNQ